MGRKKISEETKKIKLSITINPELAIILKNKINCSKYIELLVFKDLKKSGEIKKEFLL